LLLRKFILEHFGTAV